MPDELRLVRTTFGELAIGDRYIDGGTEPEAYRKQPTQEYIFGPPPSDMSVYAVLPAEPPIDRARVLAVLKRACATKCPECHAFNFGNGNFAHRNDCETAAVIALLEGGE